MHKNGDRCIEKIAEQNHSRSYKTIGHSTSKELGAYIHYIDWLLGTCAYSSGNINMDLIKNIYCILKQHMCICTFHDNH